MNKKIIAWVGIVFNALNILSIIIAYMAAPEAAKPAIVKAGAVFIAVVCAATYVVIAYFFLHAPRPQPATSLKPEPTPPIPVDPAVKDSDPKLEIEFVDDRWASASEKDYAHFELINRGTQSEAMIACMEPFQVGSHRVNLVKWKVEHRIPPSDSSKSFYIEIEQADNHLSKLDIFDVFYQEWEALRRPQLRELPIPIRATYQDAGRNLFETRCELVFSPGAHIRKVAGVKVFETRNHKVRKVAAAISRINWA